LGGGGDSMPLLWRYCEEITHPKWRPVRSVRSWELLTIGFWQFFLHESHSNIICQAVAYELSGCFPRKRAVLVEMCANMLRQFYSLIGHGRSIGFPVAIEKSCMSLEIINWKISRDRDREEID
jgi:hypothetical protein